jgi:methylmalonyl-CoA mutase cobalamin-binding subunit
MGFDRAYAPGTRSDEVIAALERDFEARGRGRRRAEA